MREEGSVLANGSLCFELTLWTIVRWKYDTKGSPLGEPLEQLQQQKLTTIKTEAIASIAMTSLFPTY